MKRTVAIIVSCMTIIILTGCTLIHGFIPPESKLIESYTLNERQKKILSKEGLPTYTFEKAGNYQITVIISDRFDNETYYNCNYSVVEPYSIDHPVVASVYTDKPRYYNAFVEDSFVPSSNWQEMSLYIEAIGGSGEYEYSFELIAGEDSIYKNYSKDNSFTIERKDFPGLKEYQIIQTENRTHWNEPEYIEQHYDWHNVKPYELHITVRDSNGDVITETVTIEAIQDFDMS